MLTGFRRRSLSDQPSANSTGLTENDIYAAIGSEGIERFVRAFYQQVPQDDILGPMYPEDDLQGAEERLRMFLIFRFGGPQDYLQHRGHPKLRLRHAPFTVDQRARDRWVRLMDNALEKSQLKPDATRVIQAFLSHIATFLINQ
jgi:hemoglobin